MKILSDNNLSHYVTMRLGGLANAVLAVYSEQDIVEAFNYAHSRSLPLVTIGGGSNTIFRDSGFSGVVIINKIPGLVINKTSGVMQIGAGVLWNDAVQKAIDNQLSGIECMALIPGTAGAAPVNNIGAFGQEIQETLVKLKAFDTKTNQFIEISNKDCAFSYRDSLFKTQAHGRFIISQITIQLKPVIDDYQPPNYPSLLEELTKLKDVNLKTVQQTIINIRKNRLPDTRQLANTGSFFKNPIIPNKKLNQLLKIFPDMPNYFQTANTSKVAAGWLIEQAGLKNYRQNGIWVYEKQALIIVNESSTRFSDLWLMVEHIIKKVNDKFGIILAPEPEII